MLFFSRYLLPCSDHPLRPSAPAKFDAADLRWKIQDHAQNQTLSQWQKLDAATHFRIFHGSELHPNTSDVARVQDIFHDTDHGFTRNFKSHWPTIKPEAWKSADEEVRRMLLAYFRDHLDGGNDDHWSSSDDPEDDPANDPANGPAGDPADDPLDGLPRKTLLGRCRQRWARIKGYFRRQQR